MPTKLAAAVLADPLSRETYIRTVRARKGDRTGAMKLVPWAIIEPFLIALFPAFLKLFEFLLSKAAPKAGVPGPIVADVPVEYVEAVRNQETGSFEE